MKTEPGLDHDADIATRVIFWFVAVMVLGTLVGAWVKWFWIGYVMGGC